MDELNKQVDLLREDDHSDVKDKWEQINFLITDGESADTLKEQGTIFKQHIEARIGMIQMEIGTYKRLETKQKGLNEMMSAQILQNTLIEKDDLIKKELNWLGSWFGIGSPASLDKKLAFDPACEEELERTKSPVRGGRLSQCSQHQPGLNSNLYRKGKAFAEKLKEKINCLKMDLQFWKRMMFLVEQAILTWSTSNYIPPFLSHSRISVSYN